MPLVSQSKRRDSKGGEQQEGPAGEQPRKRPRRSSAGPPADAGRGDESPVAVEARARQASDETDSASSSEDDPIRGIAELDSANGEDMCDPSVWRRDIQQLWDKHPPPRQPEGQGRPTSDELGDSIRRAVQDGDFSAITNPGVGALPKSRDVVAAVDQLLPEECLALVTACADSFRRFPRSRTVCGELWAAAVLDRRGESLAGRAELQRALRPLRSSGRRGLGGCDSGLLNETLARWRFISALAGGELTGKAVVNKEACMKLGAGAPAHAEKLPSPAETVSTAVPEEETELHDDDDEEEADEAGDDDSEEDNSEEE